MKAHDFKGVAWSCESGFIDVSLERYKGSYLVLFFYPMNFTFVTPTEITAFSDNYEHFHKYQCELLGVSIDSQYSHMAYTKMPREQGGVGTIRFPLLSDSTRKISKAYNALIESGPDEGVCLRKTLIINKSGNIIYNEDTDTHIGKTLKIY